MVLTISLASIRLCADPLSLIHLVTEHSLGANYVLGPVLGTGNAVGTGHSSYPWGAHKLEMGETWPAKKYLLL